jgi:hypothetical protein
MAKSSRTFRVVTSKLRDDKWYNTDIGVAFLMSDGTLRLKFDALPLPNKEGETWAIGFENKSK